MRHKRQKALDWEKEAASKTSLVTTSPRREVMNNGG